MANFLLINEAIRLERINQLRICRRTLRDATNPFELPDEQFRKLYRFNQEGALLLIDELAPFLNQSNRPGTISPHHQVLVALNVLGTGSYQKLCGQDFLACMSQSSVSIILNRVVNALNYLMDDWISFPTTQEQVYRTQTRFWEQYHFPGIIGIIDGTHVGIFPPSNQREHDFINRKCYHSLNVMLVCDADSNIIFVNATQGGRAHDSRVFLGSLLSHHLRVEYQGGRRNAWLLGDSGYPLLPYLLTPQPNQPEGTPGYDYTRAFCRIRSLIERVIGMLKGLFRCLRSDRKLHYSPEVAALCVNACCILHNMRLRWRLPIVEDPFYQDDIDMNAVGNLLEDAIAEEAEGVAVRDAIINQLFGVERA